MVELYQDVSEVPLVIAGAGGLSRELTWLVADLNAACGRCVFALQGFLAASSGRHEAVAGLPVLGDEVWADTHLDREVRFVVGVGAPRLRQQIAERLHQSGFRAATLLHPSARIGPRIHLSQGVIIAAGSTLTVDMTLGAHVLVNLHCTLGHDVHIGPYSSLAPGVHLSGAARLGRAVEVGTGAVVLPGRSLGEEARLGAGAVLTHHLPAGQTWAGVPAKPLF